MDAYKILGVSKTNTIEEIKTSWKQLVKIHHTDIGGNEVLIKNINAAYDWLKKNHVQQKPINTKNIFFRILSKSYQPQRTEDYLVELPFKEFNEPFVIHFIDQNGTEFRMNFENGVKLPALYKVRVNGQTSTIRFVSDYFMDIDPNLVKY